MAMRKVGSRSIIVDGVHYRWRIPPRRLDAGSNTLTVTVALNEKSGCVLRLHTTHRREEYEDRSAFGQLRPRDVAAGIRKAIEAGWKPEVRGRPFVFRFDTLGVPENFSPAVLDLAQALRDGQDCSFALHDALLDAGCNHLAEHFRNGANRWVLELILSRSRLTK